MADKRLIDANALKWNLNVENAVKYGNETPEQLHNSYGTMMRYEIADYIDDAPTVDAVEVVRCRDCMYRGFDYCPMCHDEYTYDEDDGGDYYTVDNTDDDGFCHMGAKLDGGAEK